MRIRLAHLLVGCALATLGACSGYDSSKAISTPQSESEPVPGTGPVVEPPEPIPGGPPEPDSPLDLGDRALTDKAAAVGDAAKMLASARVTVADAQARVEEAQTAFDADPAEALRTALEEAQTALTEAQSTLSQATADYQSALESLADSAQGTLDESLAMNVAAWAAATVDPTLPNPLADLEPLGPLVATGRFVATSTATIERTPREIQDAQSAWMTNPDALAIATEAVAYANGKSVIGGAAGLTDELPVRGITVRGELGDIDSNNVARDGKLLLIAGDDQDSTTWGLNDADLHTSFMLTADGLVMKTGGPGNIFGDMRADVDLIMINGLDGTFGAADDCNAANNDPTCNDFNRDDLLITFGRPVQSPAGDASYYWNARVPLATDSGRDQANSERVTRAVAAGKPEDLGRYEVYLSNHAGTDDNDVNLYLSHAAFGLFSYVDNLADDLDLAVRPDRLQGLHFGYDAYGDHNALPGTAITGRFEGRTMAWLADHGEDSQIGRITSIRRLRAEVTLDATIGGANTIAGGIRNFEIYKHGIWYSYFGLRNDPSTADPAVMLESSAIETDGSFSGVATPANFDRNDENFSPGTFGGNFYGPADGLEAAGYWMLLEDHRTHRPRGGHIIGSFGAVCTSC